jgi:hypothetical protein
VPQPDDQVVFEIDGVERLRWHFAGRYPRPFFFPLIGPAGQSLTRMGHPAAPDHDHHRSIWFAHQNVAGVSFWEEGKEPQIRQERWVLYEDDQDEAAMLVELGWYDSHRVRLMRQQLIVVLRALRESRRPQCMDEMELEIQATFTPEMESLLLGKTNFGFFAVRVAKSLSAHYGGGQLTNSAGAKGEQNVHQQAARWVDYSGPIARAPDGSVIWEGITYFDHPRNPHQPTLWHVRDDGWMEASFNQRESAELNQKNPLMLRYLLHVHRGEIAPERAEQSFQRFSQSSPLQLLPRSAPYRHTLRRT